MIDATQSIKRRFFRLQRPGRPCPELADFVAEVRCKLFWSVIPSLCAMVSSSNDFEIGSCHRGLAGSPTTTKGAHAPANQLHLPAGHSSTAFEPIAAVGRGIQPAVRVF